MNRFQLISAVDASLAAVDGGRYISMCQNILDLQGKILLSTKVARKYRVVSKNDIRNAKKFRVKNESFFDVNEYFNGVMF
jgi:hypothetical protein